MEPVAADQEEQIQEVAQSPVLGIQVAYLAVRQAVQNQEASAAGNPAVGVRTQAAYNLAVHHTQLVRVEDVVAILKGAVVMAHFVVVAAPAGAAERCCSRYDEGLRSQEVDSLAAVLQTAVAVRVGRCLASRLALEVYFHSSGAARALFASPAIRCASSPVARACALPRLRAALPFHPSYTRTARICPCS